MASARRLGGQRSDAAHGEVADGGGRSGQRRGAGHPVGQGHDPLGHRAPAEVVAVQHDRVGAVDEHVGEQAAQDDGVLDPGVHALPAGRAVHVGGVAGEVDRAAAEGVGDPVVHASWGTIEV